MRNSALGLRRIAVLVLLSGTMRVPSHEALRFLTAKLSHLLAAHGEVFDEPQLVLPTPKFFPDAITLSPEGVRTLLERMVTYTPLSEDVALGIALVEQGSAEAKSCSSGACGGGADSPLLDPAMLAADGEYAGGYVLPLDTALARHPVRLTTSLARSLGGATLFEAGEKMRHDEFGVMAEITAQLCGFGVLLTSGANIFAKGCSGVKRLQGTELSLEEHAYLLAVCSHLFGFDTDHVRKHFEPSQNEAWDWATGFVGGGKVVV